MPTAPKPLLSLFFWVHFPISTPFFATTLSPSPSLCGIPPHFYAPFFLLSSHPLCIFNLLNMSLPQKRKEEERKIPFSSRDFFSPASVVQALLPSFLVLLSSFLFFLVI